MQGGTFGFREIGLHESNGTDEHNTLTESLDGLCDQYNQGAGTTALVQREISSIQPTARQRL